MAGLKNPVFGNHVKAKLNRRFQHLQQILPNQALQHLLFRLVTPQ